MKKTFLMIAALVSGAIAVAGAASCPPPMTMNQSWIVSGGNFESHVSWTASAPITSVTQDGKLMPMSYPLPATNAYFNSVGLDPTLSHTYVFTVAGPPNMICSSVWQVKAYSQAAINAGGVVIDTPAPYGSTIFISAYGVFQPKESIFTTCGLQTTNAFPGTAQINLSFPSTEVSRGESCGFYIPGQSPVFATF